MKPMKVAEIFHILTLGLFHVCTGLTAVVGGGSPECISALPSRPWTCNSTDVLDLVLLPPRQLEYVGDMKSDLLGQDHRLTATFG